MSKLKSEKQIRKMLENLSRISCDQNYQINVYPIADAENALRWVLGEKKTLEIGCCSCRWPDFGEFKQA